MNITQLEYFDAVAKCGSFKKAAEKLFVSQPSVSKQISLLENEWQIQLFNRKYRSAELTASGKLMYEWLLNTQDAFNTSLANARRHDKISKNLLVIGLLHQNYSGNLVDEIASFRNNHPDIFVRLEQHQAPDLQLGDADSKFDIIINFNENIKRRSGLIYHNLFTSEYAVYTRMDHPLALGNAPTEVALADQIFVEPSSSSGMVVRAEEVLKDLNIKPKDIIPMPNIDSVLLAVASGTGISLLNRLIKVPSDYQINKFPTGIPLELSIIWAEENDNPALKLFIDEVVPKLRFY